MQRLHDVHEREMTKLRYELEQVRTEGQSAHGLLLKQFLCTYTCLYTMRLVIVIHSTCKYCCCHHHQICQGRFGSHRSHHLFCMMLCLLHFCYGALPASPAFSTQQIVSQVRGHCPACK